MKKKRRRDDDRLRLALGAAALFAVAASLGATVLLEGKHFGAGVHLKLELQQLGNLVEGRSVEVSGRDIGQVDRIEFASRDSRVCKNIDTTWADPGDQPRVLLTIWVRAGEAFRLRQNSEFFVNQNGILAPQYIEVLPPPVTVEPGPELHDGDVVCATTPPPTDRLLTHSLENMGLLRETVREQAPHITAFIIALYAMLDTARGLPSDPEQPRRIIANLKHAIADGEELMDAVRAGDPGRASHIAASMRHLLHSIQGDLATLSDDTAKLEANLHGLGQLLPAGRRREVAAALRSLRASLDDARRIAKVAETITAAITEARGTIGLLLADKEMFDDFKEMNRFLKAHPLSALGIPPQTVDEP